MDILNTIRSKHKLIKKGDFFLIKLNTPKEKSHLAIIDKSLSQNLNKIIAIKSLTKSIIKNSSVVGGIVIVNNIGSLMNRIQSELIYIRDVDAIYVINSAMEYLNKKKFKRMSVNDLRTSFFKFTTRKDIQQHCKYDIFEKEHRPKRRKKCNEKSLGDAYDYFATGDTRSLDREEKDFEGHHKWNLE
jgi:hypothetical protein